MIRIKPVLKAGTLLALLAAEKKLRRELRRAGIREP